MIKRFAFFVLCGLMVLCIGCAKEPTVDDVVAKVTEALGGAETLSGIQDQVSTWEFTMHVLPPGAPQEMKGMPHPMIITYKRPDMIRFDTMTPDSMVVQSMGYDGETGWQVAMGMKMESSEAQNKETEAMTQTWIDGFMNYQEKGFTLELMPNETVEGQDYIVIKATHENGTSSQFYINPQTYLIERQVGEMTNYMGELEPMYMTLSDYKEFDGIMMAQHVAQYKPDGTMLWEATLKEVEQNTGVQDDVFMPGDTVSMK